MVQDDLLCGEADQISNAPSFASSSTGTSSATETASTWSSEVHFLLADLKGFLDLGIMKSVFFGSDPDADLTGDGVVNFLDLGVMKSFFFGPPGPKCDQCPL